MPTEKHYADFMSPGTFFSEETRREIPHANAIAEAVEIANGIQERHAAKPYGFRIVTCLCADPVPDGRGGTMEVLPKVLNRSGVYYLGGTLLMYRDIPENDDKRILRSNMRGNRQPICIENNNSWRFTAYFEADDCIVGPSGEIVTRGNDLGLTEYREAMIEEWEAEYAAMK